MLCCIAMVKCVDPYSFECADSPSVWKPYPDVLETEHRPWLIEVCGSRHSKTGSVLLVIFLCKAGKALDVIYRPMLGHEDTAKYICDIKLK